jgi:hypothetical protein
MLKEHRCGHSTEPDPGTCHLSSASVAEKETCDVLQNYIQGSSMFICQCLIYQQICDRCE